MKFNGSTTSKFDRSEETGVHVGRLVSIIDIGTQKSDIGGKVSFKRQAIFEFEMPDSIVTLPDGRTYPRKITKYYNQAFFGEKTAIRVDLTQARGRPYTDSEAKAFDVTTLLGQAFKFVVVLNGNGNPKISSFIPLSRNEQVPPAITPTTWFDLDEFDQGVFEGLSDYVKGKIEASPEYQDIINPPANSGAQQLTDDELGALPF